MSKRNLRHAKRVLIYTFLAANSAMALLFLSHEFLNLTSDNSSVYVLRGLRGGIEVKRTLSLSEADRVVFSLDADSVFNYVMKGIVIARNRPALELTWDEDEGNGDIKEFFPGGEMLSLIFSRFDSDDAGRPPRGLFLGGDAPLGDGTMAGNKDSSGFGYYDGGKWNHIWCTTNEAFTFTPGDRTFLPPDWTYLGSRVIKNSDDGVLLESSHEAGDGAMKINMKRLVSFRAGDDYFILRVKFTNPSPKPVTYLYSWGDEPWIGRYGSSEGDVGWYADGLIKTEQVLSPIRYRYAGYWDFGNDSAGEGHDFTGHANFVEWISPTPSSVFFSNKIGRCCSETAPLSSGENRLMGIVYDSHLMPGESAEYTLAIGMARLNPMTGAPVKPVVAAD